MNIIENKNSSSLIALKWGSINAILSFIYTLITKYSGMIDNFEESIGWLSSIFSLFLTITILVLALREFREQNGDELKYSSGLGLSTLTGAVTGLISGAFNYIYLVFIDNSSVAKQLEQVREKWEEQGLSQSQIEQAEKMTSLFMGPGVQFVTIVFVSVLFFFLFGLIVSGILKREKSIFE
jgi:hypothetical protein